MKLLVIPVLCFVLPSCAVTRVKAIAGTRPAIRFEDSEAAQTFYDAVLEEQFPSGADNSVTFALAPLDFQREDIRDSAAILADAIPRADRDGNGTITMAEARSFGGSITR